VRPEGLGKFKKFFHLIGSRTRDLLACSIVSQPLHYRMSVLVVKCKGKIVYGRNICIYGGSGGNAPPFLTSSFIGPEAALGTSMGVVK
jgi:hypothetical protein